MNWTAAEDAQLLALQSQIGNHWAKFRSALPGRSVIQIKNRWVSLKRRGLAHLESRSEFLGETAFWDFPIDPVSLEAEFPDGLIGPPRISYVFPEEFFWGI
jgi:hypothetical protein